MISVGQEIYVEESNDAPDQDKDTKVYRRTLYLVIPSLKPSHAGNYVCKAENQVEMKEKTFEIVVQCKCVTVRSAFRHVCVW